MVFASDLPLSSPQLPGEEGPILPKRVPQEEGAMDDGMEDEEEDEETSVRLTRRALTSFPREIV